MDNKGTLKVFETSDVMSVAAADLIVQLAAGSIAARGRFIISLSGGSTPNKLYSLLSSLPFRDQIEWGKTFVFWGDERCVPMDDERNNSYQAKSFLLDKIDIPTANIYPIPVYMPPVEAANTYERTLQDFFGKEPPRFDLILLGLGDNGHTASLFPGTAVLHESKYWVKEVYVDEQKMFRITMTPVLLNQARNIVFLVAGKEKATILKTILNDSFQPDLYPAQLIKPAHGNLYWYGDANATSMI